MQTIPQKAADVTSFLVENAEAVWAWVSAEHYAHLRAANADELLVRVGERFDFGAIEAACHSYRRYAGGRGQEADHTIGQLVRTLLIKALKGWSLRQTCREVRSNSLVRSFVGYRLNQKTLSFATLQRFEAWVGQHHPRLFFNEILRQIGQDFPLDAAQPQVGDTFALVANVAPQSRTDLLRNATRKLRKSWESLCPEQPLPGLCADLTEALWGTPTELSEYWLDKDTRDERERQTALAADAFLRLAQAAQPLLPQGEGLLGALFTRWLGLLEKVLTDEFVFERSAPSGHPGDAGRVRHASEKERGSFVLGSSVDPEATFRKHGDKIDLGYNIHVSATGDFVREIFATTGAVPDATGVAALIEHQRQQGFGLPPKLIYDKAAGSPKTFYAVDTASKGQTQLVAALIDHSKNKGRFGPLDFTLNQDGSLTCPAGQTTTTAYRSNSADGWNYRFSAKQCQDCPLGEKCRGPQPEPAGLEAAAGQPALAGAAPAQTTSTESQAEPATEPAPKQKRCGPKPNSHRQVFISSYRAMQRQAILYTRSEAFKADMKLRPSIKRIIAALVRYNGARRAKSTGLAKADFQVRMAAVAFNLKRWLVLALAQEKAQRVRQSHDPPKESDG